MFAKNQADKDRLKFLDKLQIALQIAQTVHFLHQSDLKTYHRDLKAENILVKQIGDSTRNMSWQIKLSDFGQATCSNKHKTTAINDFKVIED